jgi:Rieske Fe-S protein
MLKKRSTELQDEDVFAIDDIQRLTRRQLCQVAAGGLVALTVPACAGEVEAPGVVAPGPTGVGPDAATGGGGGSTGVVVAEDAGSGSQPELDGGRGGRGRRTADAGGREVGPGSIRPDAGSPGPTGAATCGSGGFDTGRAPATFAMGTGTYFSAMKLFVCRDAGGLYALSAACTHAGVTINFQASTGGFRCFAHGSRFDLGGEVTRGPARSPLSHFLVCVGSDGTVQIDARTTVNAATRLAA